MGQWRRWILVVGVWLLGGFPGTAWAASEVDILLDKLVDKGILSNVEVGLIRREIAETKETRNKDLAKAIVPDSARNWKWKGDIRLRDEIRNREGGGGQADTHRQRIRFRYGFEGKVNDQLKVQARVATGSSTDSSTQDPISTNQSFNTNFVKVPFNLDLANLQYTPNIPGVSKSTFVGGIMENPFWTVSPLVWDGDLSFSGVAAKVEQELGPAKLFVNSGAFSLDTDETETASIWSAQGGIAFKPFADAVNELLKNLKLIAAIAYHDYKNVANASKAGTNINAAFTTNTAGAKDFNEINPSFEVATKVAGLPVSTYLDWVHNASAGSDNNDGVQIGLKLGKAKNPIFSFSNGLNLKNGWEAGYFFQELQANAAFDEFVDSDFNGGGTNNRGHAFWVTLATLKNSTVGAKWLIGERLKGSKDVEDRLQLDWVTKF
ncbi:MAG: hypothetical protein COV75_00620 [Candidatus Omnitrophica bacterium CG11_big_fil_rev_8_21_14_0_20_63_9]|nr:MAG: hypothetical protein COV75_00620 [Candidatus Omnitrophica bacterium CG11_big_fil_rev_8_21_14_0_20_63_9]